MLKTLVVQDGTQKKKEILRGLVWGPIEDKVGRAFDRHEADLSLIPGTSGDSLCPARSDLQPRESPEDSWVWFPRTNKKEMVTPKIPGSEKLKVYVSGQRNSRTGKALALPVANPDSTSGTLNGLSIAARNNA